MKKLFFYTRKVMTKDKDGKETVINVRDCFNLDCVVRGTWANAGVFVVMLNDGHEESKDTAQMKNGEVVRRRDWYVSQIELFGEDIERFIALTEALIWAS